MMKMSNIEEKIAMGIAGGLIKLVKQIPLVGDLTSEMVGTEIKGFVITFFGVESEKQGDKQEEKLDKSLEQLEDISRKINRIGIYLKDLEKEIDELKSDVNMQLLNQILSDNTHRIIAFNNNICQLAKKKDNKVEYDKYYAELMAGEFGRQGMSVVNTTISFAANCLGNGVSHDLFEVFERPVKRKYLWEHEAYPECTEFETYICGIFYLAAVVSASYLDYKLSHKISEADRDTLLSEHQSLQKAVERMSNRQQELLGKRYSYPYRLFQYDYKKRMLLNCERVRSLEASSVINDREQQELPGGSKGPAININLMQPNNDAISSFTEEMLDDIRSKRRGKSLRSVLREVGMETKDKYIILSNSMREDERRNGKNGFQYLKSVRICYLDDPNLKCEDKTIAYSYLGRESMPQIDNVVVGKCCVIRSTESGYGSIPDWLKSALPENVSDQAAEWWLKTFPEGFPSWWSGSLAERIPEELLENLPRFTSPGISEELKEMIIMATS